MRLLGRLALIPFRKRSAREIERKRTRERERENSGKQKRIILIECPNYYIIGGGFIATTSYGFLLMKEIVFLRTNNYLRTNTSNIYLLTFRL